MRRLILSTTVLAGILVVAGCGGTTNVGSKAAAIVPASVPAFVTIDTEGP